MYRDYAISPSLTDHDYEKWKAQANARDAALESFAEDWKADIATDYRCMDFKKIDGAMEATLNLIYSSVEKTDCFNRLIFALWYDPNSSEKARELSAMIEKEINAVIEENFEKATDRR